MKKRLFYLWVVLSLGLLFYYSNHYLIDIPLFTLIWLVITFLVVLVSGDEKYAGFNKVEIGELFFVLLLNLLFLGAIFIVLEPLSNTYQDVINIYMSNPSLNPAYHWFTVNGQIDGLLGFFLINFFIIIFAEELFFRGFLIQYITVKLSEFWAVLIQAVLFLLFIVFLKFNLDPVQNYIYLIAYMFFGRAIIGGWAASRTDSIWPSLFSVSLIETAIVFFYFFYPIF